MSKWIFFKKQDFDLWRGGIAQEEAHEEEANGAEEKTVIDLRPLPLNNI